MKDSGVPIVWLPLTVASRATSNPAPVASPSIFAWSSTLTIPLLNTSPSGVGGLPAVSYPSVTARPLMVTDETPTSP